MEIKKTSMKMKSSALKPTHIIAEFAKILNLVKIKRTCHMEEVIICRIFVFKPTL